MTDPDGQVHGVPGLFLAGASLFPTSGYANPVFTIAATALHVADAVAGATAPRLWPWLPRPPQGSTCRRRPRAGSAEAKRWLAARRRAGRPRVAASTGVGIVWTGPGRAELLPVEVPAPAQGQVRVLVDVSAVSLGTERARWLGLPGAAVRFPHQPGYSLAGTVHDGGRRLRPRTGTPVAVWGRPTSRWSPSTGPRSTPSPRAPTSTPPRWSRWAPSPSWASPGRATSPGGRRPSSGRA